MSSNFDLVEGEWKNFIFKRVTPTDYTRVLDHIRKYFILEEPTCQLLGYSDNFAEQLLTIIKELLNDNLSFLVEEKTTKELAAVRVTFRQSKRSVFTNSIDSAELDWRTDAFLNSIDLTENQKNEIFSRWNIEEYAELFIVATNSKFRNQGLLMELYNRSLKFLKAEGFKLVKCILTNPTTRRAGTRLGFQEFCKIDYRHLKDVNGKHIFPIEKINNDHFAVITLKQL